LAIPRYERGCPGAFTERSGEGTQQAVVAQMQTRADLYDVLNYHAFEAKLDQLFAKRKNQ
jgi:methylisocitrate lyase